MVDEIGHFRIPTQEVRYEDNAEIATVEGWVCKTCQTFYGNGPYAENTARYCHATSKPCPTCQARIKVHSAQCDACWLSEHQRREDEAWVKLVAKAQSYVDGTPVYSELLDRFYMDGLDEAIEELRDDGREPADARLRMCVPDRPPEFSMQDFLENHLPDEDHGDAHVDDADEVEKAVNAWIKARAPFCWRGEGPAIDLKAPRLAKCLVAGCESLNNGVAKYCAFHIEGAEATKVTT